MKILFLTPQLPFPLDQGAKVRNYHLLKAAAQTHQVHLMCFTTGDTLDDACQKVLDLADSLRTFPAPHRSITRRAAHAFLSPLPDMAHRLASAKFRDSLRRLLAQEPFDVVQAEGIEMAPYLLDLCRTPGQGRPSETGRPALVYDAHNAEYLLQRRLAAARDGSPSDLLARAYSTLQAWKLAHYEAAVCRCSAAVAAVSVSDARALADLVPGLSPWVVPNGVDVQHYRPSEAPAPEPRTIVFVGTLDYRPNAEGLLWFLRDIWPAVRAHRPDVHFVVVGRDPPPAVKATAAACDGVIMVGQVPDERPYLSRAAVHVLPLRVGGGSRLKALAAMAAGVPIVSTGLGMEGIDAEPGEHFLQAEHPIEFGAAILRLLEDEPLRRAIAASARSWVEQHYSWDVIAPRLLAMYDELGRRRSG